MKRRYVRVELTQEQQETANKAFSPAFMTALGIEKPPHIVWVDYADCGDGGHARNYDKRVYMSVDCLRYGTRQARRLYCHEAAHTLIGGDHGVCWFTIYMLLMSRWWGADGAWRACTGYDKQIVGSKKYMLTFAFEVVEKFAHEYCDIKIERVAQRIHALLNQWIRILEKHLKHLERLT